MSDGGVKTKKRKYIPGLALFRFKPKRDWSIKQAEKLYNKNPPENIQWDTIFYEDCIRGLKKLPANCIDQVIADPPFGIKFSGKEQMYNRMKDNVIDGYVEVPQKEYDQFTDAWISELPRVMKETATAYIFSGWTNLETVLAAARRANLFLINHIIWEYQFGVFTQKKFVTSHYHLLLLAKNPDYYFFNKVIHYPSDVWRIKREYLHRKEKNGTKLPNELIQKCLDFGSMPGDLVLDPFMGNGTTAEVAKANFRHYLGFEINLRLKRVINKNISNAIVGQDYQPYKERAVFWLQKNIDWLSKKYKRAYEIWLKEQKENNNK